MESHHADTAGEVDLTNVGQVQRVQIIQGVEVVIQRIGVEIVQVEKHSAFCAGAELVEERFFRVILTRVTKIRDVVFEQERATKDIREELHAGDQKFENFAVIGDWQGNGGVYFLIVTGTDSCER